VLLVQVILVILKGLKVLKKDNNKKNNNKLNQQRYLFYLYDFRNLKEIREKDQLLLQEEMNDYDA
jgi:hypothetical protein